MPSVITKGGRNRPDEALKIKTFSRYKRMVSKGVPCDWEAMITQKRVAIYARVSTIDKGQDPETQLRVLARICGTAGLVPAGE